MPKGNAKSLQTAVVKGLDSTTAHFTAETYVKTVETTKEKGLQRYMKVELEAITEGITDPNAKTFVDIGAGYGRVLPYIGTVAHNVVAVEINPEMFSQLSKRAGTFKNVDAVFGDALDSLKLLEGRDVNRPVILLLQNTLGTMAGGHTPIVGLLVQMSKAAKQYKGEIIISLFRKEALGNWGLKMYKTLEEMVGEIDLEKTNLAHGNFVSKTGYVSHWWSEEEIEGIKRILGGKIVKEYTEENFYILHLSFA